VPVGGVLAGIVEADLDQPEAPGPAEERRVEGRRQVLREDREDVDAHAGYRPLEGRSARGRRAGVVVASTNPSGRSTTT